MEVLADMHHFIYQATAASWPFFVIATIVFGMRSVSRIFYTEASAGWEDVIISLSWFLDVVRVVSWQMALSSAKKLNPNDLPNTLPPAFFWALFTDSFAFLSITLPKVGVAFLLVRIFHPRPWVRASIFFSAFGLFVICIIGFILCFVQCTPVAGQWDPFKHPEVKCWPRKKQMGYSLMASSLSALIDLVFAVYPCFVIWNLQLPSWKKVSTIGFMGLGVAAFAIAVVKVNQNTTLLGDATPMEFLVKALRIGLWNGIENDFVMIAACLPSIRPLLKPFGVFTRTHLTSNKPTRMTSDSESQHSLKRTSGPASRDEFATELGLREQPPRPKHQEIYVQHDVSLQREKSAANNPALPSYNFDVR